MLQFDPGIYPCLQFSEEDKSQLIQNCVEVYCIDGPPNRGRHVTFGLKNLSGVSPDAIACISTTVFQRLYRAGCRGNSQIRLQVKQGYDLEPGRPMGSLYTLQTQLPLVDSESGISHAYAFVEPEKHTGHLCFYIQAPRQNANSIIQRVIDFIMTLISRKVH